MNDAVKIPAQGVEVRYPGTFWFANPAGIERALTAGGIYAVFAGVILVVMVVAMVNVVRARRSIPAGEEHGRGAKPKPLRFAPILMVPLVILLMACPVGNVMLMRENAARVQDHYRIEFVRDSDADFLSFLLGRPDGTWDGIPDPGTSTPVSYRLADGGNRLEKGHLAIADGCDTSHCIAILYGADGWEETR